MRTIQTTFQGTVPKLDAKLLPDPNGQVANGIDVNSGAMRGLRDSALVYSGLTALSPTSRKYQSLFRYDYDEAPANNWLAWEEDVNVCHGPLADDTYRRIYMSGVNSNGATNYPPQMRYLHFDNTGLTKVEAQAILGYPSPTSAPVIATTALSSSAWARVWNYWYEETDSTRKDMQMFSLRRPRLNNVAELKWVETVPSTSRIFYATLSATDGGDGGGYTFPSSPLTTSNLVYNITSSKPIASNVTMGYASNVGTLADNKWTWAADPVKGRMTIYIKLPIGVSSPDFYSYNSFIIPLPSNQTQDGICGFQAAIEGVSYSLVAADYPVKVDATASSKLVIRLMAYTSTGAMLGQLYPDISAWGPESDLYINGAKVTATQRTQASPAAQVFALTYNTQSSQYYSANRTYIYTRVSELGEESAPSDPSNEMVVAPNLSVLITNLDDDQPEPVGYVNTDPVSKTNVPYVALSELRIYRTVTSSAGTAYQYTGSVYFKYSATTQYYIGDMVLDVSPGTDTYWRCTANSLGNAITTGNYWSNTGLAVGALTFQDNITDAEVGESIPTLGWETPAATWMGMVAMPGAFLAMWDGDKTIYFSEPNYPHAWPRKYGITLDYKIKGMAVSGNTLVVGTEQNPYLLSVTDPSSVTSSKLASQQPCTSKRSMLESGGAIFYASPDGVVSIAGAVTTIESEGYITKAQWWEYQTKSGTFAPEETMISVYDDVIYVFCAGGSFTFQSKNFARGIVDVTFDPSAIWLSGKDDALYFIKDEISARTKIYDWMAEDAAWIAADWKSKNICGANSDVPAVFRLRSSAYPTGMTVTINGKTSGNTLTIPVISSNVPLRIADYGTLNADEYFNFSIHIPACVGTQTEITEALIMSRETIAFDGSAISIDGITSPQLTWRALKYQFPRMGTISSMKICAQDYSLPTGILCDLYCDDVLVLHNIPLKDDNAIRLNDYTIITPIPDGITWEVDIKGNNIVYDILLQADIPTLTSGVVKFVRQPQQTPILRAMTIIADKPVAFSVAKVMATKYYPGSVVLRLFGEDPMSTPYTHTVTDNKAFRLPVMRKSKRWELDVVATGTEVQEITISNSIFQL